jgi:hypothetical protein
MRIPNQPAVYFGAGEPAPVRIGNQLVHILLFFIYTKVHSRRGYTWILGAVGFFKAKLLVKFETQHYFRNHIRLTTTASPYCFLSVKFTEKHEKLLPTVLVNYRFGILLAILPLPLASIGERSRLVKAPEIPASIPPTLLLPRAKISSCATLPAHTALVPSPLRRHGRV